jgi:hypothetical protein
VLLAIDGVLNAISPDPPATWPEWTRFHANDPDGGSWRMQVSLGVVEWLKRLHESGRAEIRWHTTWQEGALDIGDVLGLPTFQVAHAPESNWNPVEMRRQWWKAPAAIRVTGEEKRRLIWIDDDISDFLRREDRLLLNGCCVLLNPKTAVGLTEADLARVDHYLDRWEIEDAAASADTSGDTSAAVASAA